MPYQEGDQTESGNYIFRNGGWQPNTSTPALPEGPVSQQDLQDIKQSAPSQLIKGGIEAATSVPSLYQMGRQAAKDYLPEGWSSSIRQAGEAVRPYLSNIGRSAVDVVTNPNLTDQAVTKAYEDKFGKLVEPQTTLGKFFGKGLELAPSMIGPGGEAEAGMKLLPWLARKGMSLAGAAGGNEAAGEFSQNNLREDAEPWMRMAGMLAGGHFGPAIPRKIRTPVYTSPGKSAVNDLTAQRGGPPQTAAEATASPLLNRFENWLGQSDKFATPQENVDAQIRALRGGTNINFDSQLQTDLDAAKAKSLGTVRPNPKNPNEVEQFADKVLLGKSGKPLKAGSVTSGSQGDFYDDMRNQAGKLAASANRPETADAYLGIQKALDSAAERTAGNPPGAWPAARAQATSVARGGSTPSTLANRLAPGAVGTLGGLGLGWLHGGDPLLASIAGTGIGQSAGEVGRLALRKPYYSNRIQSYLQNRAWPWSPATSVDPMAAARLLATQSGNLFGDQGPQAR